MHSVVNTYLHGLRGQEPKCSGHLRCVSTKRGGWVGCGCMLSLLWLKSPNPLCEFREEDVQSCLCVCFIQKFHFTPVFLRCQGLTCLNAPYQDKRYIYIYGALDFEIVNSVLNVPSIKSPLSGFAVAQRHSVIRTCSAH